MVNDDKWWQMVIETESLTSFHELPSPSRVITWPVPSFGTPTRCKKYLQLLCQLLLRSMIGTLDSPFQTPSEPPSWPHYPPFSRVGVSSRRQARRRLGLDSWHRPCNDHLGLIESTNNYWVSQRMDFPKIGSEEKNTYQIFRQRPTNNDRLKCTHHPSNSPFGAKSLLNSSSSSHRRSQSPESLPQSIGEGADAGV